MAAKLTFVEEVRTTQPLGHVGINRNNRLGAKVFDAWNAPTLMMQSAMGRRPIVKPSSIGLTPGKFGIGAYCTSGSVRYDIGEHGEYGTHSFVAIVSMFRYASPCSVVRKDGAYSPVQVANATVRGVPWAPLDGDLSYFAGPPSGTKHSVFIFNRVSQSTVNLILNGVQVASKTNLTGYGSTTNPLCFLGTESNEELFTIDDGLFFCGIAFKEPLSSSDIVDITNNPWQIFEPEEIQLFKPITTGVVTLAILEALHGHTGDNIAFSLDTFLSAQDSAHAHAADNLSLSLDTFLAAQDASHAQSAENLTLDTSTTISLILSEAFHGLSSDVISFITGSYLQVADALHGHSADSLALATTSFLAVADALHTHAADNLTLDTSNATPLTPQDSAHAHSADNTALTLDTWLAIVEAIHAQSADNVSISSEELLSVADALHSLASDALVLSLPSAPGTCPTAAEIAAAILAAAQITPIHADVQKMNGANVIGDGTAGDKWRGA